MRVILAASATSRRCHRPLCLAALALVSAGCGASEGPKRVPLHGTARVDGEVVTEGAITVLPADGHSGPAASTAVVDGEYEFTEATGPVAGPHRAVLGVTAIERAEKGRPEETEADLRQGSADAIKSAPAAGADANGGTKSAIGSGQLETRLDVPSGGESRVDLDFEAP